MEALRSHDPSTWRERIWEPTVVDAFNTSNEELYMRVRFWFVVSGVNHLTAEDSLYHPRIRSSAHPLSACPNVRNAEGRDLLAVVGTQTDSVRNCDGPSGRPLAP